MFPNCYYSHSFEPMLRTVLLADLEDASDAQQHRTLETDATVATALGFDPADIPDRRSFDATVARGDSDELLGLDNLPDSCSVVGEAVDATLLLVLCDEQLDESVLA